MPFDDDASLVGDIELVRVLVDRELVWQEKKMARNDLLQPRSWIL